MAYKVTLSISGMACGMCEAHINDTVRREVSGARKVKSSHTAGECTFVCDEAPDADRLLRAISDTGYEMTGIHVEQEEKKRGFFHR